MSKRRWLLIALLIIVLGPPALVVYQSWRHPVTTGAAVVKIFHALPPGVRQHALTWQLTRAFLRANINDDQPHEVARELAGENGKRPDYLVVALGDSTTQGLFVMSTERWSFRLQKMMAQRSRKNVRVVNAGIAGEIATNGLARLERDVLSLAPDLVIVGYLINDGRLFGFNADQQGLTMVDRDEFLDAMKQIVVALNKADIPVMVQTCHPIQPAFFGLDRLHWASAQDQLLAGRVEALRELAAAEGATLVDTYSVVAGTTEQSGLYLADNIHLNAKGHKRVARKIFHAWADMQESKSPAQAANE